MTSRRAKPVIAGLAVVWCLILLWQMLEHRRVKAAAQSALINRSEDITATLGLVIRSQRRFGGIVSQERLESALKEMVRAGEMTSVALLNAAGEVVVSAGAPIDFQQKGVLASGERWDARSVTLVNPVDLGANVMREGETNRPTIVLPRREPGSFPPGPPPEDRERPRFGPGPNDPASTNLAGEFPGGTNGPFRWERGPPRGGRPPRMSEEEYKQLLERRGLHGLAMVMSTDNYLEARNQDLWMRGVIVCFASLSAIGLGLAWRNIAKSSELQMRLVRASEMNAHLKEMNIAAAGLAHETRNPLNIIRGMAQMISKQTEATPDVRQRSRDIIDETDRVTAQLNEFINYSRPREVRRAPVALGGIMGEVVRALNYDIDEKRIRVEVVDEQLTIEADEQLLRQALFNLLLNAVQAVDPGGEIQVVARRIAPGEACLEVRDNGPGVALEHRADIFKPYFTTHQKGTGLGLAVVQQIVLAHGWEVECQPNQPRGAVFRISHVLPVSKPTGNAA